MYKNALKPLLDFVVALVAFICLFPVFFGVVLVLSIHLKGSPFFFQRRPGKNGKIFSIVKFKTMNDASDASGNLLPDADRLTSVGKFIRSTSLDEIPQLINVIKGDMSFVGPRPLLVQYLPLYNKFQNKRHEVKPGITGYAQVNGRNTISWEKKFELDVYYVERMNFILDVNILLSTAKKVFMRSDITNTKDATMYPFKGTKGE